MPLIEPSPEAQRAVVGLRVVRHFTADPVDDSALQGILDAARWTGSSKNTQDWRFAVLTDPDSRQRLADTGHYTDALRRAPLAIALIRTADGHDFDIGRLAQNIMLSAAAHGLGSCPITLHDEAAAREALGLGDDATCGFAIAIGHPDEEQEQAERAARKRGAGRKPLDELLA